MSSLFSTVAHQLESKPLPEELQAAGADLAAFIQGDALSVRFIP